ncbi:MAG: protein translocase subunit SecF [Gammaproteobacteria bacterium]|nr:protein translocase subunit SecF [Gammaproteobacteria bacterium]
MSTIKRFWNGETRIDFFRARFINYILSAVLTIAAAISLAVNGLNFGLDFTGGTLVEVSYAQAVELDKVRDQLEKAGYGDAIVQHFGSARDVSVRVATREGVSNEALGNAIVDSLKLGETNVPELKRLDYVGAQVGDELAEQGGMAVLATVVAVLIYVAVRFEWKLSVGAIIATVHDAFVVLGIFSFFKLNFDLNVMASVMALLGYSLNDTVVIFDRIRENFRMMRKGSPHEIMNASINQTLARTVVTSGLTFAVSLTLFLFGGPSLHEFSLVLLIGVFTATYSSIYVASAAALDIGLTKEDLMPSVVEKEGEDQEAMP